MSSFIKRAAAVAAGLVLSIAPVVAEDYPARPITLVVPYSAGGPSDLIGRLVGDSMSKTLGQQIVVENVTGAGGTLGASRVARSDPDGYTLLIHHIALPASAALYDNLNYDTATGFEPLGLINTGPMVVVSRPNYEAADAAALIAKIKADGGKTTVGNAGIGSNAHLCASLLQRATGAKFTQVPYRGTGPAMTDLIAGQIDMMCDQSTNAVAPVQTHKIKGFAVSSKERLPALKDLPTLDEAGLTGFEFVVWHGLYAPKGTPKEILAKLHDALLVALKDEKIVAKFAEVGTTVFPEAERTPEAHKARLEKELAVWKKVFPEPASKSN
ncbi:tripartite tricarboxylate transporter substrate binding protein BugD [Chelatococcus sambhunathii]|uniref:Tripartite tricarboxylate transporter substrate binding protein BugD n=1 Tax=Chelatococcus sambhunathii TaxID=363953 RepID=A0ABU1DBA9_9HYPH|nr:tripartite tricarboxylate transporter substrate-binding protein [Chelatococcus sambhunathii]MDR4305400.1 tripartite tricarboxylate transporter substrate binding protein BugD [Chelatococcus sambhunathii]